MNTIHPPETANGEREAPIDIEALVNRFLSWHLPNDFHPDGGVSLDPKYRGQVVGTNLLTATQAHAMVEHMLGMAKIGQPGEYGAGYQISTGAVGLRLARAALSQSPVAEEAPIVSGDPLFAAPPPAAGAEQDAAQYRWLLSREHASIAFIWLLAPYRHVLDAPSLNSPEEIDTAVAMAMAKKQKP